ncbi:MAG: amidohydrolase family protein, partial [Humibacter sp.]
AEADGFCTTPGFIRSARSVAEAGLSFDACVRPRQLSQVTVLADAVPDLTIVLDHLGKPDVVDASGVAPWAASLRELARRANVYCKLSGMPAQARGDWTYAQMRPLLDIALDAVGPDRLLFGSDWPVSSEYGRWFGTVRSWLTDTVDAHHLDAVLAGNAERIYRLS